MTSIAAWGKLPGFGDFLRVGSDAAPILAFDAAFSALRLDEERAALFAASVPAVAFIHHADRWWGAVVLSSTDAVGRHAPFVAVAGLRSIDPNDEVGVLPLAFAPFIQRVLGQHAAGWPADSDGVRSLLLDFATDLTLDDTDSDFVAHLEGTSQASLANCFGGVEPLTEVLRTVVATATGLVAGCGLRIAPVAGPVQAGFWLSAVSLIRNRDGIPGPSILHPGNSELAPSITQLWTAPTAGQLAAALWPSCSRPALGAQIIAVPATEIPEQVSLPRDLLAEPRAHLRDLLYRLVAQRRTQRYVRPSPT